MNLRRLFSLCVHEAGHTVAAAAFGLKPCPRLGTGVLFTERFARSNYKDHSEPAAQAVVTLSGIAAEAILIGKPWNGSKDREKAARLLGMMPGDNSTMLSLPCGQAALDIARAHRIRIMVFAVWLFAGVTVARTASIAWFGRWRGTRIPALSIARMSGGRMVNRSP